MLKLLHQIRRWVGVDRAIAFTLLNYGLSALVLPLSLFLVAHFFSPTVQGFYFTFSSILALQVVFELGFSQCITQFASHEFAQLSFISRNMLAGDAVSLDRLASLARLAFKWYLIVAILLFVGVGAAGYWFFNVKAAAGVSWLGPWVLVCAATALNLTVIPCLSLLEGCNRIPWTAGIRCAASLARALVLCAAIASGMELYALGLAVLAYFVVCSAGILFFFLPFYRQLLSCPAKHHLSWRKEIWPFQWKIALSWMSGYFVFQLFTPVLFRFHGPIPAGQFGMTWALVQGLSGVAMAWGSTKIPRYGMLIKQRKFDELDVLWRGATIKSVIVSVLGGSVLLAGTWILKQHFQLGGRLLDIIPTFYLVLATVLNQIIFAEAFYLRAHKKEPFLVTSLTGGLVTALLAYWLGKQYSAMGVSLSYGIVAIGLLPWASTIFLQCRKLWHS
jgi:O-antigen/teichoic acid export membrane protein